MDPVHYPLPSFHFGIEFNIPGVGDFGVENKEALFQSVSGLEASVETETLKEGGLNTFEHILPVKVTYSDLILKRGLLTNSQVIQWCINALNMQIQPATIKIFLLGEGHQNLMGWNIKHAWPKKWSVAEMNAEQNQVLIETIEFKYNSFNILTP